MLVRDYISAKLALWGAEMPDELLEAELYRAGENPVRTVMPSDDFDKFWYELIPAILMMPKSVSEGGYSVSYDAGALKSFYSLTAKKLGLADNLSSDKIIDITNRW